MNSSNQGIVLSHDSKKLLVQRFVKVFDQNRMHADVRNQRIGTPDDFTGPW